MSSQDLEKRNKILERRWKWLLAFFVLFIITRPLAVYVLEKVKHHAEQQAVTNEYPMLDPARQFVPQKDYIISLSDLRSYFSDLSKQYPDNNVSIYYEQLNSGANTGVNQNGRFFPASLNKLPLAIVAVRKVEDGEWNWDTKLTIQQNEIDSGSGNLYQTVKPGDQLSVQDLLNALLVNSDNTAHNVFLDNVSQTNLNNFIAEVGLEDLFDQQGFISSKEYARVLRVLWTSDYLQREDSQKILQLMAQDNFHDFLSQGIPADIMFAHKWGENVDQAIFADAGIVYQDGHPFMIAVILKGKDSSQATLDWAKGLMKEIAQKAIAEGNTAK